MSGFVVEVVVRDNQVVCEGELIDVHHVERVADRDNATGLQLLAKVDPTLSRVRLAPGIPARMSSDTVPDSVILAAGHDLRVVVHPAKVAKKR